jgi:hypothetical protein
MYTTQTNPTVNPAVPSEVADLFFLSFLNINKRFFILAILKLS